MSDLSHILKQIFVGSMLCLLAFGGPLTAYAQATDLATQPAYAGIIQPTGASAATYHYNVATGLWENEYYTWSPVTKETTAKVAPEYTYNQQSGQWDSAVWGYHPSISNYELVTVSVTTPPSGAITHGGPPAPAPIPVLVVAQSTVPGSSSNLNSSPSPSASLIPSSAVNTAASVDVGADSKHVGLQSVASSTVAAPGLAINTMGGVTLANTINSTALSGNAILIGNTTAGNATTGNASAVATIMNLLQSSTSLLGRGAALFTTDIQGDVTGDLLIDPAALVQPATAALTDLNNVTINSKQDGAIQNDINLSAASGNAGASDNRDVGNATTGTATAVANVLNLINSVVAANQSFLGVINIYGNFTGDILVPTDTLNALLAGNAASGGEVESAAPASGVGNRSASTSDQQITNNVDLAALSGNAVQSDNTHTGSATTGGALTKLTILNLTGHKVDAANSLLVFVNVLGTWVGVIMDAPTGTTAAVLTGGDDGSNDNGDATADSQNMLVPSSGQQRSQYSPTDAQTESNNYITNNITARAVSGDAMVSSNTRSGDATSGNASASANIFNLINSQFSLSHWFGVLFINVFGAWHGNFGAAKPVANPATQNAEPSIVMTTGGNTDQSTAGSGGVPRIFRFNGTGIGRTATGLSRIQTSSFGNDQEYEQFVDTVSEVLGTNDIVERVIQHRQSHPAITSEPRYRMSVLPLVLGIAGLTLVGSERIRAIRRRWAMAV